MYNKAIKLTNEIKGCAMPIYKTIDVNAVWGDMITAYSESPDKPHTAENFAEHCVLKHLRENPNQRAFVFDMTEMKFSPSIQATYSIAYYLVKQGGLTSKEIVERIALVDKHDLIMSNYFIRAVFEATGEIPPVVGSYSDAN